MGYPESAGSGWHVGEDAPATGERHPFDLEERTARFGEAIIRFVKKIPHNAENNRLIDQLVGCGTSVGNAGTYSVLVKNPVGSVTSDGALLTVNPKPVGLTLTKQPMPLTIAIVNLGDVAPSIGRPLKSHW